MILAITFVIFLAILVITHEFGHFIAAKFFKLRVDEFAFGFPPKIFSFKKGETTYSLNSIPLGGFVKIYGESEESVNEQNAQAIKDGKGVVEDKSRAYYTQAAWKRVIILVAGVAMNFLVGWIALSAVLFFSPQGVFVSAVLPDSPAEEAGIKAGDKLTGFTTSEEFISYINANAGKKIILDGKEVTPRVNPNPGEGRLGVQLVESGSARYDLLASLSGGFTGSIEIIKSIIGAVGGLVVGAFKGSGEVLNNLSGPIGIVGQLGKSMDYGFLYVIEFLAILSLNLAVFNMLPVPALDGGRLLFVLIELVIRRKLDAKYEGVANMVGVVLLILLAVTITGHDVWRIFAKS